ncbi:unnamed protein product [Mytilus edulis]|uniref:Mitochondria-eating protein n=1 Tax=Mytilus edulis TaxID=6550 RepID=A0A8S3Q302_MYTED|nr:unnamed protein product [Mytilus edulis]
MTDNKNCCCLCRCCKWICGWIKYICCCVWCCDYEQLEGKGGKRTYPASKAECRKEIDKLNEEVELLTWRLQVMDNENKDLRQEKDAALSRLSEMMGSKLRDNNPAIADLNDQNRPMKLAEQFTELYENEWTDAFTDLQDLDKEGSDEKITDIESIQILLKILKEINDECVKDSSLQLSGLKEAFQVKYKTKVGVSSSFGDESNCKTVLKYKTVCQQFIEVCVKICYLSAVQDPPMFLDFEPNETFDKSTFKEFTVSGSLMDYLVWPALLIQKDGAILSKGVVQPKTESEDK